LSGVDGRGVYIIFTDGTKISFPKEKIDVDAGSDGFRYTAFITLSASSIETFKKKTIAAFKLYIHEVNDIDIEWAERSRLQLNCMTLPKMLKYASQ
jgi:hypothetical protein